jgi:galactose mutarotase-like enzyme
MTDTIQLSNDQLSATITPLGAELRSLRDADGRELMTDADPAFWTGHAPILFPVVGRPSGEVIRVGSREYPMKQHGFARHQPFSVEHQAADAALLVLTDSPETRAHYPFAFRLELDYRLNGATLLIQARVHNPADTPLLASFGFHPAFAWPLPYGAAREDHAITFAADEPDAIRAIAADGTIKDATRPSPLDGRTLALADDLVTADALVWDRVRSDRVTYGASTGQRLEIGFPDTPMLGIWTKPGARFVCVEPWHGIADPEGYRGEFADKPGVFTVAPGDTKRIGMSVTLRA